MRFTGTIGLMRHVLTASAAVLSLRKAVMATVAAAIISSGFWLPAGITPALAFPGWASTGTTISIPAGGFVREAETCSPGSVVLGGGADVVDGSANFGTELQESAPGTSSWGSLWLVAVSNHSSSSHDIDINAICGTAPSGYTVAEHTVSLPAGGFVRQAATCPAGTVVLGGGAAVVGAGSANFGTELQESAPGTNSSGSIWLVAVSNHSSTSYNLRIFAVCATAPSGYTVAEHTVSLPAGGFVRQDVTCPAGTVVLSGGAQVVGHGSANFGTELQESNLDFSKTASLWVAAVSNHSSASYNLGMFAVCAT